MKSTESSANIATKLIGIARDSPRAARVQWDAPLASFLLASPPPKTTRGVELADSTLRTVSPRATLLPGMMQKTAARPSASATVRRLHPPSG